LPVVVVAANRLGVLNHALLTVESIRARGLECAGIILNHTMQPGNEAEIATSTNAAVIEEVLKVPILFEVGYGQEDLALSWHKP